MQKASPQTRSPSKPFDFSPKVQKSSKTLNSTSTVELPSSLREHFEKTKDFEWGEDSPKEASLEEKTLRETPAEFDVDDLRLLESAPTIDAISRELFERTVLGCVEAPEIFYRKNIFDNQLERIIEEVSNEAFSSFLNKSTAYLNSSLQKQNLNASAENLSKDNLVSLNAK